MQSALASSHFTRSSKSSISKRVAFGAVRVSQGMLPSRRLRSSVIAPAVVALYSSSNDSQQQQSSSVVVAVVVVVVVVVVLATFPVLTIGP